MSGPLRAAIADLGGDLAVCLRDAQDGEQAGPAQLAASGPRAAAHRGELEVLLEMIREGSELHYGTPRVVQPQDEDLGLLLGDQLYALGLLRLAEIGDLDAVCELADIISLEAQAAAAEAWPLRQAIWSAGARAIGWGTNPAHLAAKQACRRGDPLAAEALRGAFAEGC